MMYCLLCKDSGRLPLVRDTIDGKELDYEPCDCVLDRKDYIYDVREAAPKSANCSKEGAESPE